MSTATERAGTVPAPKRLLEQMRDRLGELGVPAPVSTGRRDPYAVLVSTVVSLRTRDAVTRKVSARLLKRAATVEELAEMDAGELEEILRPAGFYRQKARQLRSAANAILEAHGGEVPSTRKGLLSLPGVGPKTAGYVLGMAFGTPAVCVDVHVHRIANRMGLVETKAPEETEQELMKLFPRRLWIGINHVFVRYGQNVCRPRRPDCGSCPFAGWCPASTESTDVR
jgi:endonuclease-3